MTHQHQCAEHRTCALLQTRSRLKRVERIAKAQEPFCFCLKRWREASERSQRADDITLSSSPPIPSVSH
ncbi:uncharacterized [Tachysurus ichikawai]